MAQDSVEISTPSFVPKPIRSIEDTGLNIGTLSDLAIKIMYYVGYTSGYEIAERVKLPFQGVVDEILDFLKREKLCEVRGAGGLGEGTYQYTITSKGADKAREVLERTTYAGPTPVPLRDYNAAMRAQGVSSITVRPRTMRQALAHMVLSEPIFDAVGPAINSGKSLFLYGPPGNGKTTIAEAIGQMMWSGDILIPYAVDIDGEIIKVFDEVSHELIEEVSVMPGTNSMKRIPDPRWIRVRRPAIVTGGELTLKNLDLIWNDNTRFYEAPHQMKANGGLLCIDDFGRQQVRPRDLLNRWIVPLEKQIDYLTLHTGRKIEIPFHVLVVFSTNMDPKDLVDEAFLRRIPHKIFVGDPSPEEFREIFRRMCEIKKIPYDERALVYLIQEHYVKAKRKLRAVHPRDILSHLEDLAAYTGTEPRLTKDLIDRAALAYFVDI
jgi:energy-coupling factor transporter ATP-binding protein EcfA2